MNMEISFKEKYDYYQMLLKNNAQALASLSLIRSNMRNSTGCLDELIVKPFFEAMSHIRQMAEAYVKIDTSIKTDRIKQKIELIEIRSSEMISTLRTSFEFDYEEESGVQEEVESELFAKVERLTESMRDPNCKDFRIESAETPHDLIRFFHQRGVDGIFDMKNIRECDSGMFLNIPLKTCNTIRVIDLGGELQKQNLKEGEFQELSYKPLKAILELYNDTSWEKSGNETFQAIVSRDSLISQIHLGSHYAELEAQIGSKSAIKFFFRDTDAKQYKNAPQRTAYVRNVLTKLGFKVTSGGKETTAKWEGKDEGQAYKKLKEVVRLTASTKDLDLDNSHIDEYPNKAVNLFYQGETKIGSHLSRCKSKGEKDDKRIN